MRFSTASRRQLTRIYNYHSSARYARPQLRRCARSFACCLSSITITTLQRPPQPQLKATVFMHQRFRDFFHGESSFTEPHEVIYAAIRDDNLAELERLIASEQSLHLVVEEDLLDANTAGGWGTPLHLASWLGNIDAVRALLTADAEPSLVSLVCLGYGYPASPLDLAVEAGHRAIVEILWNATGGDSSEKAKTLTPARQHYPGLAARAGHASIIRDLLSWTTWSREVELAALRAATECWQFHVVDTLLQLVPYDPAGLHPLLHDAVSLRREYDNERYPCTDPIQFIDQQLLIRRLIDAGADPNFYLNDCPPLVQAASWVLDSVGAMKTLLENGADPDLADQDGNTALHILVSKADSTCASTGGFIGRWCYTAVHLMLRHHANPNLENRQGVTALQLAAQYAPDSSDFELILNACKKNDAEKTVNDFSTTSGETFLHFAALGGRRETMMELISSHRMDINAKIQTGWTPLMFALLPKMNPESNDEGWHTLHEAVRAAKLLLSHGADPLTTTERGWTPLHVLSLHMDSSANGEAKALTLDLIQRDCSIDPPPALAIAGKWHAISDHIRNPQDQWRKLPLLHWAVLHGAVDVVRALIESGADVMEKDTYGHTAREVAEESEFLREHDPGGPFMQMGPTSKKLLEVLDEAREKAVGR